MWDTNTPNTRLIKVYFTVSLKMTIGENKGKESLKVQRGNEKPPWTCPKLEMESRGQPSNLEVIDMSTVG